MVRRDAIKSFWKNSIFGFKNLTQEGKPVDSLEEVLKHVDPSKVVVSQQATIGDKIKFRDPTSFVEVAEEVVEAGWVEVSNGKVWVYTVTSGLKVPLDKVLGFERPSVVDSSELIGDLSEGHIVKGPSTEETLLNAINSIIEYRNSKDTGHLYEAKNYIDAELEKF